MEKMTAKAVWNLMTWLKEQGFDDDKIVECIDSMEENENIMDEHIIEEVKKLHEVLDNHKEAHIA